MAASTITQRITLEGAEEIKRALADIGKTGEQALRQIQDAGKGADFGKDLTGEFAKVEKAAESFGISLRNLGRSAYEFGKSVPELFGAVSAATTALTGAMLKLAKSASEVTSAVKEGSIRSGTTVKNFQELSFAAKQSGANIGTLQRAFDVLNTGGSKLEKSLGDWASVSRMAVVMLAMRAISSASWPTRFRRLTIHQSAPRRPPRFLAAAWARSWLSC